MKKPTTKTQVADGMGLDERLGMNRKIPRRDFLNGAAIGITGAFGVLNGIAANPRQAIFGEVSSTTTAQERKGQTSKSKQTIPWVRIHRHGMFRISCRLRDASDDHDRGHQRNDDGGSRGLSSQERRQHRLSVLPFRQVANAIQERQLWLTRKQQSRR